MPNDAPVVSALAGTTNYTEQGAPAVIDASITIDDADDTNIASAAVSIAGGTFRSGDSLGFVNTGTITGTYNSGTGVLTLTGSDSKANYEAALESITFSSSSNDPTNNGTAASRTINWQVVDANADGVGAQSSNVGVSTINVVAVNDPPGLSRLGGSILYIKNDPAITIDGSITIFDVDDTQLSSATVTITNFTAGDLLGFTNGGSIVGDYDAETGVLTFTGTASLADYELALESVAYSSPIDDLPSRLIRWMVTDGNSEGVGAQTSLAQSSVIRYANELPATIGPFTPAALEQIPVAVNPSLQVFHSYSLTFAAARVAVAVNFLAGQDVLAFVNDGVSMGNVTAVYNAASGVLGLTSAGATATLAQWQAALRSVTYTNTSDTPNTANRIMSFTIDDDAGRAIDESQWVSVTPINDPAVVKNDAIGTLENVTLNGNVFANNGNGPDTDPDTGIAVRAINGVAASVGSQLTLSSGALLTVNANGTFSYNPNGAFNKLPTSASGASNATATDTFSYTVEGVTAQVVVTITGVDSNDTLTGSAGNDTLIGGIGTDSVVYAGLRSAYTFVQIGPDTISIVGPNGTDLLTSVEKLVFDDQTVDLHGKKPDFNADFKGDILWQDTATGALSLWLRDNSDNPASFSKTALGGAGDPHWRVVANAGDFNGDDKSDLLWQHTNGSVVQWLMDGTFYTASGLIGSGGDPNWRIIGTGDFNGDGLSDVVWQHTNGGVTLWQRRGPDPASFTQFSNVGGSGDANWRVVTTGDFNQDGKSDLLWQHTNGALTIWLMDGDTITQTGLLGGGGDPNWRVVATGEFNGDGTENDILWQHTNGAAGIWLHDNNANPGAFTQFSNVGGAGDPNWRVKGTSDLSGDGRSDILFEHAVSGALVEWIMNGASFTQLGLTGGNGDLNWQIVGFA